MRKLITVLSLFIFSLGMTACQTTQVSTSPGSLQGDWNLVSLNPSNGQMTEINVNAPYTLSFNSDGTISGKADCKLFTGRYNAQTEGGLSLSEFSNNKVNCSSGSHANAYLSVVPNAGSFKVTAGNQLTLVTSAGDTLMFTRAEPMQGS